MPESAGRAAGACRAPEDSSSSVLQGSWDLVTKVLTRVAIRITTYHPQLRYL